MRYSHPILSSPYAQLPTEVAKLRKLVASTFSQTLLSGTLPPGFGNMSELEVLNFGWSRLSGTVPPELGGLRETLG